MQERKEILQYFCTQHRANATKALNVKKTQLDCTIEQELQWLDVVEQKYVEYFLSKLKTVSQQTSLVVDGQDCLMDADCKGYPTTKIIFIDLWKNVGQDLPLKKSFETVYE